MKNTTIPRRTALIAEDEPRLAKSLAHLLSQLWPELEIIDIVGDGVSAIEKALEHTPDIMFLDIKMPGKTGLEVAEAVADDWPDNQAMPLFVYVTAFDDFAVKAFERAAADYVLKPASMDRLALTVERLKQRLSDRASTPAAGEMASLINHVQSILAPAENSSERIKVIRAGLGNTVKMIPVKDVICFEATDKYVNVITATGSALVRMSMRELVSKIDSSDFIQVHRSIMVNNNFILSATRDELGHFTLRLRELDRGVKVSRAFSHLFRPM
ncbi:LytR/AlgR family response regulator transcription factor [Undibacterium parvum]|uniref:Response regulator transcription factor n=2 Tax=Undibacterium TaxID=401469 RepID=A0A6M4A2S0_9BURK|nr:LytTR family DNA-binding domain-containing protein [Undibacterium parvum]AZP10919.1 response regulator transcription factor [Undibacterium parvum]QJQ05495.1 response regulator transcription factor [Undibacterium piscinae]